MTSLIVFYAFLKAGFLYSLIRVQVKFEPMKDHFILFAVMYTAAVAFLSYVFFVAPQENPNWRAWEIWLGKIFGIYLLYFWLLSKYDEGVIFWTLLLVGVLLVYTETFIMTA